MVRALASSLDVTDCKCGFVIIKRGASRNAMWRKNEKRLRLLCDL
jgi:hypothetical protein